MSNSNLPTEPITADPVIVNPTESETVESRLSKLEEALAAQQIDPDRRRTRSRDRSFSPIRVARCYRSPGPVEDLPYLTGTTSLLAALAKAPEKPDMLVEFQSGPGRCISNMTYLTTLPVHQAELDKISWVFQLGIEDSWSQKQEGNYRIELNGARNRGRVEYYEDRYVEEQRYDRGVAVASTTIVKLGELFTKLYPTTEGAEPSADEQKIKFVTVVRGRGFYPPLKLNVSYSKRAALSDLFHEIINGYSIQFVGAVLNDVDFSDPAKTRAREETAFKKVRSVEEAEKVGEGVIGIIC